MTVLKARTVEYNDKKCFLFRLSNAERDDMANLLNLTYYYVIEEKDEEEIIRLKIEEQMRYFSLREIEYYLFKCGFEVCTCLNHMTMAPISETDWNAFVVAKKVKQIL